MKRELLDWIVGIGLVGTLCAVAMFGALYKIYLVLGI